MTLILTISGISRHHCADHLELAAVPVRVGDDVDRDHHAQRPGELERLEVLGDAHALAESLEALFVDRLDAQEHVLKAERLPEAKDVFVAQQDVAAGFEIVLLLDPAARDGLADGHAVLGLDEGDVVDDEDAGLADLLPARRRPPRRS